MKSDAVRRSAALLAIAAWGIACGITLAASDPSVYEDKNGYFSFIPPQGWQKEEGEWAYRSEVKFSSPDNNASIVILAELDSDNLNNLMLLKKGLIKDHRIRFPDHRFQLSRASIAGYDALKIEYEIPGDLREDFYYFYFDGMRYDLAYWGSRAADYLRYQADAAKAFSSLKAKSRALLRH